jgi:hypothetical protein
MVCFIKEAKVMNKKLSRYHKKKPLKNKRLLAQITLIWWDIENKPICYNSRFA